MLQIYALFVKRPNFGRKKCWCPSGAQNENRGSPLWAASMVIVCL